MYIVCILLYLCDYQAIFSSFVYSESLWARLMRWWRRDSFPGISRTKLRIYELMTIRGGYT